MGFRYIGAKTKLLDRVLEEATRVTPEGGKVVDLMCGTASVSAALRKSGFDVTAVDVLTFCCVHAKVALLFNRIPDFKKAEDFMTEYSGKGQETLIPRSAYEKMLVALSNVPAERGYFWREFSPAGHPENTGKPRQYFHPENAKRIDAVRTWVRRLKREGKLDEMEHSLLLHDLIMSVNDVANIAGTYGHYLSKMVERAKSPLILKPSPLLLREDAGRHRVLKGYAEDLAANLECDLCYIDPPYMKRQYAANYHILETIAREDEPEAVGVSGLRPWRDQYSNFCTKTRIRDSFAKIISQMRCEDFLISYSEEGLLKRDELVELLSRFGKVTVKTFKYKRFKSNGGSSALDVTEYLMHLQKG